MMLETIGLSAMPLWMSGLLVVALPTLCAILASALVRRLVGVERLLLNNEVAGFKFAVVGVIYAVLLAFAVVVVWEKFRDADNAGTGEAGALVALYRLSGTGQVDEGVALRKQLTQYGRIAIAEDWPAMALGHGSPTATHALDRVYATMLAQRTYDPTAAVVLGEMLRELDAITEARRERIGLASGIVPGVIWLALLLGAVVTIVFTFFFGLENVVAQMLMTGALSSLIFLGLLVIVSIDHPFTGPVSVSAQPLVEVVAEFGAGGE